MRTRSSQRGAVFVEALIVIASFIMFFMGIVYFRDLYVKEIDVARLARASTIAYSMGACDPATLPTAWVQSDLPKGAQSKGTPSQPNQAPHNGNTAAQGGKEADQAKSILGVLPGAGSDSSMLNPITHLGLSAQAQSSKQAKVGFKGVARSTSYVSCGDKIRQGEFDEVFGYVKDFFSKPKTPSL
jgi:hypothetical protein